MPTEKLTRTYLDPKILAKIGRLELIARHVVEGFISGRHESPFKGMSIEFRQHREYAPGDDLRHLDWKVFARQDKFFIKEYEEDTNLRAYFAVDCSESMRFTSGSYTKYDYACYAAASLAFLLHEQSDATGLCLFDSEVREWVRAATHPTTFQRICQTLEGRNLTEKTNFDAAFERLLSHGGRRTLMVVLSDLFTDFDALLKGLRKLLSRKAEILIFHVMDQAELEFPFDDMTRFLGMEAAGSVTVDARGLRKGYLEELHGFIHRCRRECLNHGIDYEAISTSDRLDVVLTKFLARRLDRR